MSNEITCASLTYLFDLYMKLFCKKNKISEKEFLELNSRYNIFEYIEENEEILGSVSDEDGLHYIEELIKG